MEDMFGQYFRGHGYLCASHPLEVIIGTLTVTVCLVSMSMLAIGDILHVSPQSQETESLDVIIVSIARCLAVVYVYLQFRSLRRLGSHYLLGVSGVFTLFSSFIFSVAVIKIFKKDLTGLSEALPLFLLLVDLSKACALARFAVGSTSQEEVQKNIATGMGDLGPSITLDAIVEMLVIGVGTLSGVQQLELMAYFGCLSVLANLLVFLTFYPACLALVLDVTRERNHGKPLRHLQQLAKLLEAEEKEKTPNPVTQRVKLIMSAGLVMVHIHSRLGKESKKVEGFGSIMATSQMSENNELTPDMNFWLYHVQRQLTVNADLMVTLVLAVFLTAKYMFFDDDVDVPCRLCPSCTRSGARIRQISSSTDLPVPEIPAPSAEPVLEVTDVSQKTTTFTLGDEDESSDEETDTKESRETQTELLEFGYRPLERLPSIQPPRPVSECLDILKSDEGASGLTDEEISRLVEEKHIPSYKLETALGDYERGVNIRRGMISTKLQNNDAMENLPYINYHYELVNGACCENVIGYMPIPVGVAGPLLLDDKYYHVPMATTEGCLVASTNRGCRALAQSSGVKCCLVGDGMSRAPVVRFPSIRKASELKLWLEDTDNFEKVKETFDDTSRFARLKKLQVVQASRYLYIRFVATTGDAMGMNMVSKGSERALTTILEQFPDMEILSLSGNFCTDKKPSAVNWLEGRGKSVVSEAVIPGKIVKTVLKTSVAALVDLNISKNLMGSAMAGSIGGFNAHAANVVTAIFIATGQDPAQNTTSSNCITLMEPTGPDGSDLYISCTMPSIEVGTIGGGTVLPPQGACLQMLGLRGSAGKAGDRAGELARVVCATVLAGELSLMSALAAGHLVRSHLRHNRSTLNVIADTSGTSISKDCNIDCNNTELINTSRSRQSPETCISHSGTSTSENTTRMSGSGMSVSETTARTSGSETTTRTSEPGTSESETTARTSGSGTSVSENTTRTSEPGTCILKAS
ncbi:3-hydroxy-3-methylglutaryl-coenzyme A reductase-like isoform X2 [Pecten maximus]|uniref:3-hydroxy-3-methylglutaryl-coenzyme A reductase-like isoform X2 n=1 Tax=Pecten maximus TaxID=6579 RepID=UPI001458A7EF|nr:3-hydroxy-3-methylglutaryl-coenzyme A reductase-like isoform X2 [Pecten maximus]